jgi:hypothetical protein
LLLHLIRQIADIRNRDFLSVDRLPSNVGQTCPPRHGTRGKARDTGYTIRVTANGTVTAVEANRVSCEFSWDVDGRSTVNSGTATLIV